MSLGKIFANSLERLQGSLKGMEDGDGSPFGNAVLGIGVSELTELLPQIPENETKLSEMADSLRIDLLALQGARARPEDLGESCGLEFDLIERIDKRLGEIVPKLRETDFPDQT